MKMQGISRVMRVFESGAVSMMKRMPSQLIWSIARIDIMVGYYHMISDEDVVHVKHLYDYKNVKEFTGDLDYLLKRYTPVSLDKVLNYVRSGEPLPARAFLLTFDDGFREMHDIAAPILLKKGVPAVFFLNSACIDNKDMCHHNKASIIVEKLPVQHVDPLWGRISEVMRMRKLNPHDIRKAIVGVEYSERHRIDEIARLMGIDFSEYLIEVRPYLSSAQVRSLIRDGFAVGSHSIDHPRYAALPIGDQITQTIESARFLKHTYGLDYGVFAFPHSDNGVSRRFFNELSVGGVVDLTFGTGGLRHDRTAFHIQRFSLEKPLFHARDIIALESSKKIGRMIRGTDGVERL